MKNISFYKDKNKKKTIPKNFELWDSKTELNDTNKELEFLSQSGNVKLIVKNIDRDLVPDGFQEQLEA